MRTGHLLFSAVHFIMTLFVLSLGVFSLGLAKAPQLRSILYEYLLHHSSFFSVFGYCGIALGGILVLGFYSMQRKVFYRLKVQPHQAEVDPDAFAAYVKECWKELFPGVAVDSDVIVHPDQKIEVFIKFPGNSWNEYNSKLELIDGRLSDMLAKNLGYSKEFFLTVVVD